MRLRACGCLACTEGRDAAGTRRPLAASAGFGCCTRACLAGSSLRAALTSLLDGDAFLMRASALAATAVAIGSPTGATTAAAMAGLLGAGAGSVAPRSAALAAWATGPEGA